MPSTKPSPAFATKSDRIRAWMKDYPNQKPTAIAENLVLHGVKFALAASVYYGDRKKKTAKPKKKATKKVARPKKTGYSLNDRLRASQQAETNGVVRFTADELLSIKQFVDVSGGIGQTRNAIAILEQLSQ